MSTILDALRKLQRERAPQDLRESVLDEAALPEARGGGLRLGVLLVALAATAGVTSYALWPRVQALRDQLLTPAEEQAPASGRALAHAASDTSELPTSPETAALPQRGDPAAMSDQRRRAGREAATRRAAANRVGPTQAGLRSPPQRTQPQPQPRESETAATPAPAQTATAAQSPAPAPAPARVARTPRRAPDRGLQTVDELMQEPKVASIPPAERPAPLDTSLVLEPARKVRSSAPTLMRVIEEADASDGFPTLEVEAVRWHPDPERRTALLLLDNARPVEAREGDIVGGLEIEKIEPGAIEVRMGKLIRRIQIGQ